MRALNFRDYVLNPISYKIGLDPSTNFNTPQARAIATYVNSFIRKAWIANDWPEWTSTKVVNVPANHIVPYTLIEDLPRGDLLFTEFGRVLEVYLTDPNATDAQTDIPFIEMDIGIHVGFDHGTQVWIKYLPPPPTFTTEPWDPSRTYSKGDPTYLEDTGDCYTSLAFFNINHDPRPPDPDAIQSDIVQQFAAGTSGTVGRAGKFAMRLVPVGGAFDPVDPPASGSSWVVTIYDEDHAILSQQNFTCTGTETFTDILTTFKTAFEADVAVSTFSFSIIPSQRSLIAQNASDFSGDTLFTPPADDARIIPGQQLVVYVPAFTTSPPTAQRTVITLPNGQVFPGATYEFTFNDNMGGHHVVSYIALPTDGALDVLNGLSNAITAAALADDVLSGLSIVVDNISNTMNVSSPLPGAVNLTDRPGGPIWWDKTPFPLELIDGAIRQANADVLKEWGQYQFGIPEEQMVPAEINARTAIGKKQETIALSDRNRRRSRYAID